MSLIARLVAEARRIRRRRRAHALFKRSGLFDARWYRKIYPQAAGRNAFDHYLETGAAEGLRPGPLFDTAWYVERYPDVVAAGTNPLVHFIMAGSAEARDPNPFFSTRWYLANNPDAAAYPTPLSHYARKGAAAGRDPSPRFDARWYLDRNADVGASGLDPLSHYLTIGRGEGRAPNALGQNAFLGEPVEAARITAFKALEPIVGETVALMVAHCPEGALKPNVGPYVAGLTEAGVKVVLIAATDRPFTPDPAVTALLAGGFVRENKGYDFSGWAHVLRCEPSLYAASTLILVNDSLIGPTSQKDLVLLLERVSDSDADMVGATDSREQAWHLQSFFLALKTKVLTSYALRRFFDQVRTLDDKDHVIRAYELTLTERLQEEGFEVAALFPSQGADNPTVKGWRELIRGGFPFAKTLTLRGAFEGADVEGWRETLNEAGYDPAIAEATITAAGRHADPPAPGWPLLQPPAVPPRPSEPWKVAYIGPWNYASGLGEASRGYLSALWRTGLRLNLYPIDAPYPTHARVAPTVEVTEFDGPADAAIIHLNPDAWSLMTEAQARVAARARNRIGLVVWEMDRVPESWREPLAGLDAVWAPSRYCADAFRADVAGPVDVVPHVVPVGTHPDPERRLAGLRALGFEADARVILYVFDGSSYLVRKNPDALVRAFIASALASQGWRLVLKTKHLGKLGKVLKALAEAAPGVVLIDTPLPRPAMQDLWAAADIYASPHRSEGFGLTIAEAMAAGKAVVATDYGGSRDFLDAGCGYPVRANARTLERGDGHYWKGGTWGEPDEAAFARALQQAAEDTTIGEKARARIAERLSPDAVAQAMRKALTPLMARADVRAA